MRKLSGSDGTRISGLKALFGRERAAATSWTSRSAGRDAENTAPGFEEDAVRLLSDYENSGRVWFWSTDSAGNIRYISQRIAESLDRTAADLAGTPFQALFRSETGVDGKRTRSLSLALSACKNFASIVVRAAGPGEELWWSLSGRPRFDGEGRFTGYHGSGEDITDARRERRDASRLAMTDPLTGLANRNHMNQLLDMAVRQSRGSQRNYALMMIDLDRFKLVNDSLGHLAGDELLKQVAERISGAVGEAGTVGRLGGDEFQVLLPDEDDRGVLGELARKLIAVVSQPYSLQDGRCSIGASVGIAIMPFDGKDAETIVGHADLALYASKGAGRGHFRFYAPDLDREAEQRRRLEIDLREALVADQIELLYQPIVEAGSGKVVALEAQLRWNHPDFGDVSPDIFIPIADKANLRAGLDNWAIRQACADGVQLPGGVRIAVNVSLAQFQERGFVEVVTQALASSELSPERLELEIPSPVFDVVDAATGQELASLHLLGVRLVLDAFGSGRCALLNLRNVPLDGLKIDHVLLDEMSTSDERGRAFVGALCGIGRALDLELTADGVIAHDQLPILKDYAIDRLQGDLYAAPLPIEEVSDAMACGAWTMEPSGPSRYRSDRRTVFRRVGLIHGDHRYELMMRNLSSTGCLIDGLLGVAVGEQFVVDFGDGQLAIGTVRRSAGSLIGLEFEMSLVDDGAGGLVTRNRVPVDVMHSVGAGLGGRGGFAPPRFAQVDEGASRRAHAAPRVQESQDR